MPCGHSLCAKCLFEIKKSFIHYNCPACRNTVSCEKPNFDLIGKLMLLLKKHLQSLHFY
jgi:hypothetical protein